MVHNEKSLLDLWSNAFQKIPKNRINSLLGFSGILLGAFPLFLGPIVKFGQNWTDLSTLMLQVFGSLLGFIIAGYTIFVTSANPNFVVAFWRHIDSEADMPILKLHLVVYMKLFFIIFSGTCFFAFIVIGYKAWSFVAPEVIISIKLMTALQSIIMAITGWFLTMSAVQVKAMIFNLYHLTLTQAQYLDKTDKG